MAQRSLPTLSLKDCPPTEVPAAFLDRLDDAEVLADQTQLERLAGYVSLLHVANQRMNLTGFDSPEEIWSKLIVDALTFCPALRALPEGCRVADIGTGAGIPGLPLAILFPNLQLTLVDATAKKVGFVQHAARELGLVNLRAVHGRAETLAAGGSHQGPERERFDLVTARALARLNVLLEFTVPFAKAPSLKRRAQLALVKGEQAETELIEAAHAARLLSVELIETLKSETGTLLLFEKTAPTRPEYPRENGLPKRKPL